MSGILDANLRRCARLGESELAQRLRPHMVAIAAPRLDPPRLRAGADPRLRRRWEALQGWSLDPPPATEPVLMPAAQHAFRSEARGGSNCGAVAGIGASRWETSLNWSGALITAREGTRFSAAAARWRVPHAGLPAGEEERSPRPALPPHSELGQPAPRMPDGWRCSVWVGLDGHRLASDSLPQIGTTTVVEFDGCVPVVRAYAWAQWWVRGKQYGEIGFAGFEVMPGQTVTAWLALAAEDQVVLRMRNESTGAGAAAIWGSGRLPEGVGPVAGRQAHARPAPAEGAAAAWVVERPMVMASTALYPLPRFEPVEFEGCVAAFREPGDPPEVAAGLRDLRGARLIRMFDQRPAPFRSACLALPSPGAESDGLVVRYRG